MAQCPDELSQDSVRALQESEQRMRLGLEGSNVGLWDWNVPTGEVVFVRHWAEILGYDPSEIECHIRMWEASIHPDDRSWVMQALDDHLEGRTPIYETVHRLRAKSGEWRWVLDRGKVVARDPEGRPLRAVGMHVDVTDQKRVEEAWQQERQLLREALDLQERERRLIAYEVHDGFVQEATAAMLHLQSVEARQGPGDEEANRVLREGLGLLRQSLEEARRLIHGLRPPLLDEAGVVAAIQGFLDERRSLVPGGIEFCCNVQFGRLAAPLESALFRIVQEALTNALRHSGSDKVQVRLAQHGNRIRVEVEDWGIGFQPDQVGSDRHGIAGVQERARLFNGTAEITSSPGQGTLVVAELPLLEPVSP